MRVRYCSTIARDVTRRCSMAVCSSEIVASTTVNGLRPPSGSPVGLAWPATGATATRRATGTRTTAGHSMVAPILGLPALRLRDRQHLVGGDVVEPLDDPARPADLDRASASLGPQPEVDAPVAGREVAAAGGGGGVAQRPAAVTSRTVAPMPSRLLRRPTSRSTSQWPRLP